MPTHVLLIEDDDALRVTVIDYMVRRGWRVTACASIAEATESLEHIDDEAIAPDTVVSDILLPDGCGTAFYVENARRFPRVRWMLMSGDRARAERAGRLNRRTDLPGCAVVDKPVQLRLFDQFIAGAGIDTGRAARAIFTGSEGGEASCR